MTFFGNIIGGRITLLSFKKLQAIYKPHKSAQLIYPDKIVTKIVNLEDVTLLSKKFKKYLMFHEKNFIEIDDNIFTVEHLTSAALHDNFIKLIYDKNVIEIEKKEEVWELIHAELAREK